MRLVRAGRRPDEAACAFWSRRPLSSPVAGPRRAIADRHVVSVAVAPGESQAQAFERVRDRLLAYDIFPPALMYGGACPPLPLSTGAILVQRLQLGVFAIECPVRVVDVWDVTDGGLRRAGFRYVSLQGHPECGAETFEVRLDAGGRLVLVIEARSRPGLLLTWIGFPVARALQLGMTRAALRRFGPGADAY